MAELTLTLTLEWSVALSNRSRETLLQEANTKNQAYQSTCKSMRAFLEKIPSDQIRSSDDLSQIAAKRSSQEVRSSSGHIRVTGPLLVP